MPAASFLSFVDVIRRRVQEEPARVPFRFIDGSGELQHALSYGDLDRRARAVAAAVRAKVQPGDRALLLLPHGPEFIVGFVGCLYAGVVAVPTAIPRRNRMQDTLERLIADCEACTVLTTSRLDAQFRAVIAESSTLASLNWLSVDQVDEDRADEWTPPRVSRETLAFLQYTSGSTQAPRGVMVTHGNLLHNSERISEVFGCTPDTRAVSWLPFHHDMGLISGVLQVMYCGGESTQLAPMTFLQRPLRWLQAISRTRATICGGPNFAFDLCVQRTTPEQRAALDLSAWNVAFCGAEPVRAETLQRFSEAFAPSGFRVNAFLPCYGLAEHTLIVTGAKVTEGQTIATVDRNALARGSVVEVITGAESARTLVSSGRAIRDVDLRIVDPESHQPCDPGVVGEIWLRSESVAKGYWKESEATRALFAAPLMGDAGAPFLRTGDLGFLLGKELFVTGRLKDVIIMNGRNLYPQDIEHEVASSHPEIQSHGCAAFAVNGEGPERLIVIAELNRRQYRLSVDSEGTAIAGTVRRAVSEALEVLVSDVVFVAPGGIPRTTSGKIRRTACREHYIAGRFNKD
jgi:acyl-CoA synthetase (AMP-forming)/AMP-acid ligase II